MSTLRKPDGGLIRTRVTADPLPEDPHDLFFYVLVHFTSLHFTT
jgi:hypothetical protein